MGKDSQQIGQQELWFDPKCFHWSTDATDELADHCPVSKRADANYPSGMLMALKAVIYSQPQLQNGLLNRVWFRQIGSVVAGLIA